MLYNMASSCWRINSEPYQVVESAMRALHFSSRCLEGTTTQCCAVITLCRPGQALSKLSKGSGLPCAGRNWSRSWKPSTGLFACTKGIDENPWRSPEPQTCSWCFQSHPKSNLFLRLNFEDLSSEH